MVFEDRHQHGILMHALPAVRYLNLYSTHERKISDHPAKQNKPKARQSVIKSAAVHASGEECNPASTDQWYHQLTSWCSLIASLFCMSF
jgi:hypothetical protein